MKKINGCIIRGICAGVLMAVWGVVCPMGWASAADGGQAASPVIYSVSISPAKATAGDIIQMEAIFSAFDETDRASVPVDFFYEIRQRGEVVFKSPVKRTNAANGAKSHLGLNIRAVDSKGTYTVALTLSQSESAVVAEAEFAVVSLMEARRYRDEMAKKSPSSADTIEKRLLGEWKLKGQSPDTPAPRIVFSMENGKLTARITRADVETLRVKLRKTDTSLTIRSRAAEPGGNCWYVMEDVITFNDQMADLPVRSRVLEGSGCVSVGRTSQSVLHRME